MVPAEPPQWRSWGREGGLVTLEAQNGQASGLGGPGSSLGQLPAGPQLVGGREDNPPQPPSETLPD